MQLPIPTRTNAERVIQQRIAERGPITFAEFMAIALYDPLAGYYARYGAGRDYRTSPQTSPAFAHLLGRALGHMWRALGEPPRMPVVEPGAGDSHLAAGATAYLCARDPGAASAIQYLALDRYNANGAVGAAIAPAATRPRAASAAPPAFTRLVADASALPLRPFVGAVLSNELFDALPVHRLIGTAGSGIEELYVDLVEERLAVVPGPLADARAAVILTRAGIRLRPGQVADVASDAAGVYAELCRAVERGFILTIDYGGEAEDLYGPHRLAGTLVAYHRHRATDALLENVGEQDLTAHVDFGLLQSVGDRLGLRTLAYTTQRELLLGLGLREWLARLDPNQLTPADLFNARHAAEDLVRPDRLGKLRVLLQARDVAEAPPALLGGAVLSRHSAPCHSERREESWPAR